MDEQPIPTDTGRGGVSSVLLLGAAITFAMSAFVGAGASISSNNCGELPGIYRTIMSLLSFGLAGLILIGGLVASAVTGRGQPAGRAALIAFALAGGVQVGELVGGDPTCGPTGPLPTSQAGTLSIALLGLGDRSPTGPAVCERTALGESVRKVSSTGYTGPDSTPFRISRQPAIDVMIEVWPDARAESRPAEHVRIDLNRRGGGADPPAFAYFSDGHGETIQVAAASDGSSGTIRFTSLGLWEPNASAAPGMPSSISGTVTWSCAGPER